VTCGSTRDFTWRDGERVVRFGRGAITEALELLGVGYVLLTTARARALAPEVVARAQEVHEVAGGRVDDLAAELLERLAGEATVVALGGGRVIDVAKAVVAALGGRVAAVPTTLSAAEMTRGHRHARGVDPPTPKVRPAVILNDPALSASQPPEALAASAANALAHAAEAPATTSASPVPSLAAAEAARLIGAAWGTDAGAPDRDALALGALLSGYAIDAAGYGLHHVLAQTLVRVGGAEHGPANAALLPHTLPALAERDAPGAEALVPLACALARRAGAVRLQALGIAEAALDDCTEAALQRAELAHIPPPAGREEIRALYAAAW